MSKKDEFKDLRQEVLRLKSERQNHGGQQNDNHDYGVIERVKSDIEPVLKAFIDTDQLLDIQSIGVRNVYIAYAHTKVCGISISATSADNINVYIHTLGDSFPACIYSGKFNKNEIKNAVKNALLSWYKTL